MQKQVVHSMHLGFTAYGGLDPIDQGSVHSPAEQIAQRIEDHLNTRFTYKCRNYNSNVRLYIHLGYHIQNRGKQHRARKHGVEKGICSRGLQCA